MKATAAATATTLTTRLAGSLTTSLEFACRGVTTFGSDVMLYGFRKSIADMSRLSSLFWLDRPYIETGSNSLHRSNAVAKAAPSKNIILFCVGFATNAVRLRVFRNMQMCAI
ncbi:hypothetical protein BG015_011861 [Linnemannia schmuckeri]|uniref:Uncharacterized protein n=1 Tax=Linnemannia schmuckeri TaxID=64567 RepID=A0A9P5S4D8_9FUNG|nr:hypothetical protein BG015_011861 [Linnemannia schmuckeri]